MKNKIIVVALGGNAILQANEKGTYQEQVNNVKKAVAEIVKLIKEGYKVVLTHGNGPQVGRVWIYQDRGSKECNGESAQTYFCSRGDAKIRPCRYAHGHWRRRPDNLRAPYGGNDAGTYGTGERYDSP